MSAYAFFDVREVIDREALGRYRSRAIESVIQHGGRYLLLGGQVEPIEGTWRPTVPVLIRFADLEAARRWYESADYAPLKAQRLAAARADAVLMQSPPSDFIRD